MTGPAAVAGARPIRPASHPRQRRVLVTGPRAAAVVTRRRAPGDVVLDLAAVHAAVGGTPGPGRLVALSALHAARQRVERLRDVETVWLVHPNPTPDQRARYLSAGYELVDTGPAPPDTRGRRPREGTGTATNVQAAGKRHQNGASMPRGTDDGGA